MDSTKQINPLQVNSLPNVLNSCSKDQLIDIIKSLDQDTQQSITRRLGKTYRTYCFGYIEWCEACFSYIERCDDIHPVFRTLSQYELVTKEQLVYKIMRDDNVHIMGLFGNFFDLYWKEKSLKQYDIFKDLSVYLEEHGCLKGAKVTSEQMVYLYTKVLRPLDLLDDIQVVIQDEQDEYCYLFFAAVDET